MTRSARALLALSATALAAAAATPAASPGGFGGDVARCAHEHLGQRADPPQVTCMGMTFPTFGAMVLHMRQHHGA